MFSEKTRRCEEGSSSGIAAANYIAIQRSLQIGTVNDPLEDEADTVADKVMRMPEPAFAQRKCTECEEIKLQRKSGEESSSRMEAPSFVYDVLNSGGQMLDSDTRNFFEPRFGHDFSDVRIHDNKKAAESANSINALAYTVGNDIVFNKGQYSPNTDTGKKLLGHELTHVLQQKTILHKKTIQREICAAPSVLLNMATFPGTLGNISSIAGQVAEIFIIRDYCKTGCAPMVTEYFDNPIIASYIAFLAHHNPHLNITQLALIAVTGGFQRPDILVDKGPLKEMYEIKPRSPDGILAGIAKLLNLQAFMSVFSLPYITGVTYTPSNPLVSVNVTVAGYDLTVTLNAYRIAPGLIVYEFCFSEALMWTILLAALIIVLIILAPEIAGALAPLIPELLPVGEEIPSLIPIFLN
jgi:hypothetical protein